VVSNCTEGINMGQERFNLGMKKPDIEVNKPAKVKFWQQPNVSLVLYVLFILHCRSAQARHSENQ